MSTTAPTHRDLHPQLVDGCFACKIRTINLAPSATPSRRQGAHAAEHNRKERQLGRDLDAYKRLRRDGVQPTRTNGAAHVEQAATCVEQIESGMLHVKERSWQAFGEEFGHSAFEPQTTPVGGET